MSLTVSPIYAGLLGLFLVLLSALTIRERVRARVSLGDGGDARLTRAIRVQGNFAEYAPLALVLIVLAELQGAPALAIHALGLILLAGRVVHAAGLMAPRSVNPMRTIGMVLTFTVLALAGTGLVVHALI